MKDFIYCTIIAMMLVIISLLMLKLSLLERPTTELRFIWNDTEDSIPVDGSLIQIEFTNENDIYLCPIQNTEYKEILDRNHIDY